MQDLLLHPVNLYTMQTDTAAAITHGSHTRLIHSYIMSKKVEVQGRRFKGSQNHKQKHKEMVLMGNHVTIFNRTAYPLNWQHSLNCAIHPAWENGLVVVWGAAWPRSLILSPGNTMITSSSLSAEWNCIHFKQLHPALCVCPYNWNRWAQIVWHGGTRYHFHKQTVQQALGGGLTLITSLQMGVHTPRGINTCTYWIKRHE